MSKLGPLFFIALFSVSALSCVSSAESLSGDQAIWAALENENIAEVKSAIQAGTKLNTILDDHFDRLINRGFKFKKSKDRNKVIDILLNARGGASGYFNLKLYEVIRSGNNLALSSLVASSMFAKEDFSRIEHQDGPLFLTVDLGQLESLKILLKNPKFDLNGNSRTLSFRTLLSRALSGRQYEIFDFIASHKDFDFNGRLPGNRNPAIHLAAEVNDLRFFKRLLADPRFTINDLNRDGETPLHRAAMSGSSEVVKYILAQEDFRLPNESNGSSDSRPPASPLQIAVSFGHLSIVKLLDEDTRFDINELDSYGENLLMRASSRNFPDMLRFLLNKLRAPSSKNSYGESALHKTVQQRAHFSVRQILESELFEVDLRNNDGATPLFLALSSGQPRVVRLLLKFGSRSFFDKNNKNLTAISLALNRRQIQGVRALANHSLTSDEVEKFYKIATPIIDKALGENELAVPEMRLQFEDLREALSQLAQSDNLNFKWNGHQ